MRSFINIVRVWLILMVLSGASASVRAAIPPTDQNQAIIKAEWETDLDEVIGLSRISLKPILAFFTAPNCPECTQLKRFTLGSEALQPLLREFERVEVDLSTRSELAMVFQIENVPALYVIEPDGRIRDFVKGYRSVNALKDFLTAVLREYLPEWNIDRLVGKIDSGEAGKKQWRKVLFAMGHKDVRRALEEMLGNLTDQDRAVLVSCLSDRALAVRLGALDLLEDLNDGITGYDPWQPLNSDVQKEALARWSAWAGGARERTVSGDDFTRNDFDRLLGRLIGEETHRSASALRKLYREGEKAEQWLKEYLDRQPSLTENALQRVKEAYYALIIPPANDLHPQTAANRIVRGNQDVQIRTIRQLEGCGEGAYTILVDLLKHKDPLVRESAVETLFAVAGERAVLPAKEYLGRETDPDIVFTVLRRLGDVETPESLAVLVPYFSHDHEDLAIAAIESAVQATEESLADELVPLLEDQRWRVRVAAVEALEERGGYDSNILDKMRGKDTRYPSHVSRSVIACLDDPDAFVRHTAAVALGEMDITKAANPLIKACEKHPAMLGVVASVLLHLDKTIPSSFIDRLFGPEPDDLLFVLDRIKELKGNNRNIVHRAAASDNMDVACSALRILADSEKRNRTDNALLVKALQSGVNEKMLTVIQEFTLDSEDVDKVRTIMKQNVPEKKNGLFSQTTDADVLITMTRLVDDASVPPVVRNEAMVLLCWYGHPASFKKAESMWDELSPSMRETVAQSLSHFGKDAVTLFAKALDDPYESVWEKALGQMNGSSSDAFAEPFAACMAAPECRLNPAIVWENGIYSSGRHDDNSKAMAPFVGKVLADIDNVKPGQIILALAVSTHTGLSSDQEKIVTNLCRHDNPFIRRAAWTAFVANYKKDWIDTVDAMFEDTSPYVRSLVPALLMNRQYNKNELTLYFSEDIFFTGYEGVIIGFFDENSYEYSRSLTPEQENRLQIKINDETDALIRFHLMLSLLSYQVPLDLNEVVETANASGNPDAVAVMTAEFFADQSYYLGSNFKALIPLTHSSKLESYYLYGVEEFTSRWSGKRREDSETLSGQNPETPLMATFFDPYEMDSNPVDEDGEKQLMGSDSAKADAVLSIEERAGNYSWMDLLKSGAVQGANPNAMMIFLFLLAYLIRAGKTGKSLIRFSSGYLFISALLPMFFRLLPHNFLSLIAYDGVIRFLFLYTIALSFALSSLVFLARSITHLRKKTREKKKKKKPFTPGRLRIGTVVAVWGLMVSLLNLVAMGNGQTATIVYMIKNHAQPFVPFIKLVFFCLSFLIPSVVMLGICYYMTRYSSVRAFFNRFSYLKNFLLLLIWASFLFRFIRFHWS